MIILIIIIFKKLLLKSITISAVGVELYGTNPYKLLNNTLWKKFNLIIIDKEVPIKPANPRKIRYNTPISLALVLNNHLFTLIH
jgi:hypothetical protein